MSLRDKVLQSLSKDVLEARLACERDLYQFACVVFPDRYYADVHKEFFHFLQREDGAPFRCGLIPRDHQKSHCMVVYCAWRLCVNPDWTFVYVSANPDLAGDQLNSIRAILTSPIVREMFPELIRYTKDNRTGEWKRKPKHRDTNELFSVDHPVREDKRLRDPSIRATSVKSSKTGFHCKEVIFDDLVTDENFESEADRKEVLKTYKNLMKIATTDSLAKAVGTRYSDKDLYGEMKKSVYEDWEKLNEEGEPTITPLWEFFERVIEDSPRRTGEGTFIFPKKVMPDGSVYGFDRTEWSKKKASLSVGGESASFYAQYYNDPNDSTNEKFDRSEFQYWEPRHLQYRDGRWFYADRKLSICAAADLAWTDGNKKGGARADYTACAVVGVCTEGYVYVLDHIRFKTDKPEIYYGKIKALHERWTFRDLYIETNSAGKFIKMSLEDEFRKEGRNLIIHGKTHAGGNTASKEERIAQTLFHRYKNRNVFHYRGGLIGEYEDELVLARSSHDDLKDATAHAVSNLKKPVSAEKLLIKNRNVVQLSRFGGRRRRA